MRHRQGDRHRWTRRRRVAVGITAAAWLLVVVTGVVVAAPATAQVASCPDGYADAHVGIFEGDFVVTAPDGTILPYRMGLSVEIDGTATVGWSGAGQIGRGVDGTWTGIGEATGTATPDGEVVAAGTWVETAVAMGSTTEASVAVDARFQLDGDRYRGILSFPNGERGDVPVDTVMSSRPAPADPADPCGPVVGSPLVDQPPIADPAPEQPAAQDPPPPDAVPPPDPAPDVPDRSADEPPVQDGTVVAVPADQQPQAVSVPAEGPDPVTTASVAAAISAGLAGVAAWLLPLLQAGSAAPVLPGGPLPTPPGSVPVPPQPPVPAAAGAVPAPPEPPVPAPGDPPGEAATGDVGDAPATSSSTGPSLGDRVWFGRQQYVWQQPVDDPAGEPSWVPAQDVDDEPAQHEAPHPADLSAEQQARYDDYVSARSPDLDGVDLDDAQRAAAELAREAAIDRQVDALRDRVGDIQRTQTTRGYYVRNTNLPDKAYNNTVGRLDEIVSQDIWSLRERALHEAREQLAAEGVAPDDPAVHERAAELANELERDRAALHGSSMVGPLEHTPEHFASGFEAWRGGQCGEFADWGAEWSEDAIREVVGDDAVITRITLERNHFSNHRATRVILPSGERVVIDFWEGMANGEPRIYREAEWVARWDRELRLRGMPYGDVTIVDTDVTDLERQLGNVLSRARQQGSSDQDALELFVAQAGDDPAAQRQRQIVAASYRRDGLVLDRMEGLAQGADRADRQGMYDAARRLLDAPRIRERIEGGELTEAEFLRDWARRGPTAAERDARQVVAAALEEHRYADVIER